MGNVGFSLSPSTWLDQLELFHLWYLANMLVDRIDVLLTHTHTHIAVNTSSLPSLQPQCQLD